MLLLFFIVGTRCGAGSDVPYSSDVIRSSDENSSRIKIKTLVVELYNELVIFFSFEYLNI